MPRSGRHAEFAAALFVVGLLLFNYPLLSAGVRPAMPWGIPALMLYLLIAWVVVIVAIAWGERRLPREGGVDSDRRRDGGG